MYMRTYNRNSLMKIRFFSFNIFFFLFSTKITNNSKNLFLSSPPHFRTDKNAPPSYYTLGSLLHLLQNERLTHALYAKQANSAGIVIVRRPDRKDLLAYLNGEKATTPSIDKFAPLEPPITKSKRNAESELEATSAKKPRLGESHDNSEDATIKRVCLEDPRVQKLAAKLDDTQQQEISVVVDNIKSLSEAMSVEKIAEIKAKRIAKKRTTIKDNDDIGDTDEAFSQAFDSIMDVNAEDTMKLMSRERHYRTRKTILQSTGKKEFLTNVLNILNSVATKEATTGINIVAPQRTPMVKPRQLPPQLQGYDRYDQQRFVQQKEAAEGFVIDTMGTYHGMTLKSVTEGVKPTLPSKPVQPVAPTVAATTVPKKVVTKRTSRTPIIVVPSSEVALITTYNAADVLQDLQYKSTAQKKAQGVKRENEILLQRRKQGNLTVPYLVIDNPLRLKPDDWDRVVAVFVQGPAWQFKGWPYNGNPVEIFSRIPAFHLKYDDMPIDANVAKWAVKIIELNKTRRHLDRAAIIKIWEALDQHMIKNKQFLRF